MKGIKAIKGIKEIKRKNGKGIQAIVALVSLEAVDSLLVFGDKRSSRAVSALPRAGTPLLPPIFIRPCQGRDALAASVFYLIIPRSLAVTISVLNEPSAEMS